MTLCGIVNRLKMPVARFVRGERGNVAMMFAIMLPVLLTAGGAAIDYSRAANARAAMQAAADATALMISREAAGMTESDITTKAQAYFNALYNHPEVGIENFTAAYTANSGNGASIVVTAGGTMQTDFMKIAGQPTMELNVASTTKWGNRRYRVALALDNTGSMAWDDKIGQLKIATKKLIEDFYAMAGSNDDIYISIVPFAKGVNVGASNYAANWIRWDKLPEEATVIDTAWEAEPPVMSNWLQNSSNMTKWEQTGPGDYCPFSNSDHGFRCAPHPTSTSTVTRVPDSGTYSGYICPSIDTGNKVSYRNGIEYNGCYTSTLSTRTISDGSGASCGTAVNCSCSGSGSSKVCTQKYYLHEWRKVGTAAAPARTTWKGCVADRDKDFDVSNTPPSSVRATMAHAEQYRHCGEAMMGMTSVKLSKQALIDKVDAMYPNGSTNQGVGLAWAWLTHAKEGPFKAPDKDPNYSYTDVIILLTDGLNTQSRYAGNGSNHSTAIDDRQALMCENIKKDAGMKIFAVQVATDGDPQSSMLKNCTSDPNNPNYFSYITQASQMTVKFQNIFKELAKLRVAA
jgi:Flp pilus assembly protein TadG